MSAHTPGPWVAQGRDGLEVMGPEYRIVTIDLPVPPDGEAFEDVVRAKADARLIAQSPRMLEALAGAVPNLRLILKSYRLPGAVSGQLKTLADEFDFIAREAEGK